MSQSRSGVPGPRDPPAPQVPSLVMVTRTASDTRQQAQEWPRSGECPLTTLQSLCIPVSDHNTGLFIISSGVSVMCQAKDGAILIFYRAIILFLPRPMQYSALPRGSFTERWGNGVTLNFGFGFNLVHVKYSQVSHIWYPAAKKDTFMNSMIQQLSILTRTQRMFCIF